MDSSPKNYDGLDLRSLRGHQKLLEKKLGHLQSQLEYRIFNHRMASEKLQMTIRGLAEASHPHLIEILALRTDKLRFETELADMEEEVFRMMQKVREMCDDCKDEYT